jgi:4-hydroxybenzoate polyprenyltransferase
VGARFWLAVAGISIATAVAAYLIFLLMGYAWYAWGFFGMLILFGGVMILLAWLHDRRAAKRRAGLDDDYLAATRPPLGR